MPLPVHCSPHWVRIHDADTVSLLDWNSRSDLNVAVHVEVLGSVVTAAANVRRDVS